MVKDWLKLLHLNGVSLDQKRALINYFDTPGGVLSAQPSELIDVAGIDHKVIAALTRETKLIGSAASAESIIDAQYQKLVKMNAEYVGFNDPRYPFLLNQIPSAPLGLFVKGQISLLQTPQIAIVGSRNPSPSGRRTTVAFASMLSEQGITITSGMACGIDSDAHQGCLDSKGNTIAVIGTGLDVIYPRSSNRLYEKIMHAGLMVSEYPFGTPPRKPHFPQRNRIISGLSLGTLVMEAGMRSGIVQPYVCNFGLV